jgi:antitoxin component YwqK of YwqJK toxin-antitoxin module
MKKNSFIFFLILFSFGKILFAQKYNPYRCDSIFNVKDTVCCLKKGNNFEYILEKYVHEQLVLSEKYSKIDANRTLLLLDFTDKKTPDISYLFEGDFLKEVTTLSVPKEIFKKITFEKNGIYMIYTFENNKNVKIITFSKGNKPLREYSVLNGTYNGEAKIYAPDGELFFTGCYKNNLQHGIFSFYYPNGQKMMSVNYVKGKLKAVISMQTQEGKPLSHGNLKNGNGSVYLFKLDNSENCSFEVKNGKIPINECTDFLQQTNVR